MTTKNYQIVITGDIVNGYDINAVKRNFVDLFKVDAVAINRLFCGQSVVVKRHLDPESALTYLNAISQAGAVARMELVHVPHGESDAAERRKAERRASSKRRQRLRDEKIMADRRDLEDRRIAVSSAE